MFGKAIARGLLVATIVASTVVTQADTITHGTTTINMDFVCVGNPGNTANTRYGMPGYGAVGYNYRIGKYEVSADQWAAVIAADGNVGNAGHWSGLQPTTYVSWDEAAKFCNWLTTGSANSGYYTIVDGVATENALDHNAYASAHGTTYFIPTEDEWYKAAYYDPNKAGGAGYYDYPTGSNNVPDGINFAGDTAFDAVFNRWYDQGQPNAVNNAGVLSPYGTMGQGGNVSEWNETPINRYFRVIRGGSWVNSSQDLVASDGGGGNVTVDGSYYIGFRVASIPEPGSLALLGISTLSLLVYGWRRRRQSIPGRD